MYWTPKMETPTPATCESTKRAPATRFSGDSRSTFPSTRRTGCLELPIHQRLEARTSFHPRIATGNRGWASDKPSLFIAIIHNCITCLHTDHGRASLLTKCATRCTFLLGPYEDYLAALVGFTVPSSRLLESAELVSRIPAADAFCSILQHSNNRPFSRSTLAESRSLSFPCRWSHSVRPTRAG